MTMLFIETFLLMLLAGLLGVAVGSLIGCRDCCGAEWSTDRPWLRDGRAAPAAPALPSAPVLLSDAERAQLAASLAEAAAKKPTAAPMPPVVPPAAESVAAVAVAEAAPLPEPEPVSPAPVEPDLPVAAEPSEPPVAAEPAPPEPAPVPAPSASAYELPPEIAAAAVAPTVAAEDAGRAAAADAVGIRPLALAAPVGGKADDLKRIRGIGPQNERKLHGLGVYHFSQIAAWTAENAKWAGSFMAFPGRIEREEWIAQAKVLATGAETEFSKRVDAGEVPTSQSDGKKG